MFDYRMVLDTNPENLQHQRRFENTISNATNLLGVVLEPRVTHPTHRLSTAHPIIKIVSENTVSNATNLLGVVLEPRVVMRHLVVPKLPDDLPQLGALLPLPPHVQQRAQLTAATHHNTVLLYYYMYPRSLKYQRCLEVKT